MAPPNIEYPSFITGYCFIARYLGRIVHLNGMPGVYKIDRFDPLSGVTVDPVMIPPVEKSASDVLYLCHVTTDKTIFSFRLGKEALYYNPVTRTLRGSLHRDYLDDERLKNVIELTIARVYDRGFVPVDLDIVEGHQNISNFGVF